MHDQTQHGPLEADELAAADELYSQNPRPWEAVAALVDADLLTERQAEIYVRRRIEAEPADAIADDLGIARSTFNNHLGRAKDLVEAAERTVHAIEQYRAPSIPDECAECGESLGGRWAEDDDGRAMCYDCAGIDPNGCPEDRLV